MVTQLTAGRMYLKAPQKAIPHFLSTNSLLLTPLPKKQSVFTASLEMESQTQLKLDSLPNYQSASVNSFTITNQPYSLDIHIPLEGKKIHAVH